MRTFRSYVVLFFEFILFRLKTLGLTNERTNGILCERISKHVYEEIDLVFKSQPIWWTASFKYLGSFVSSHELLSCLEDSTFTNAGRAGGAVRLACRSAVAVPVSRLFLPSQIFGFSDRSAKLRGMVSSP